MVKTILIFINGFSTQTDLMLQVFNFCDISVHQKNLIILRFIRKQHTSLLAIIYFFALFLYAYPVYSDRPKNIEVISRTYTSLTIQWQKGGYEDNRFEIRLQTDNGPWNPLGWVDTTSYDLINLKKGARYRFKIRSDQGGGWEVSEEIRAKMYEPDTPYDFRNNSEIASSSELINVIWEPDPGYKVIDSYEISYRVHGESEWLYVSNIPSSVHQYVLVNLVPSTKYDIRLRAVNSDASSQWASLSLHTLPADPPQANVLSLNTNDATIGWNLDNNIKQYQISYRELGKQRWILVTSSGTTNRVTLEGLNQGKSYQFRIRSDFGKTKSLWSSVNSFTTLTESLPAVVSKPVVNNVKLNQVELSWDILDGSGEVDGYNIAWKRSNADIWKYKNLDISKKLILNDLISGTLYTVKVRSLLKNRKGKWSPELKFETESVELPDIEFNSQALVKYRQIQLTWNIELGREYDNLQLQYRRKGDLEWMDVVPGPMKDKTNLTVNNLSRNTLYQFRIRSINSLSSGDWSKVITVSTGKYRGLKRMVQNRFE